MRVASATGADSASIQATLLHYDEMSFCATDTLILVHAKMRQRHAVSFPKTKTFLGVRGINCAAIIDSILPL